MTHIPYGKVFHITDIFRENSKILVNWIPGEIKKYIESKLGIIPTLGTDINRLSIASAPTEFYRFIQNNMSINQSNFEVFRLAIIKIHLEKFAY
jgi:hypothetical protein